MLQDSSSSDSDKNEDKSNNSSDEDSYEITNKNNGPVTIYLEGEPTLTRCQLLQRHLQENNSLKYVAQCDEEGRFIPTQCYTPSSDQERFTEAPKCWCVDETGHKTQPTVYFTRGERECGMSAVLITS